MQQPRSNAARRRVDMYVRRPYLPQVKRDAARPFPGFLHGWSSLSDAERWTTMVYLNDLQAPVPHETATAPSSRAASTSISHNVETARGGWEVAVRFAVRMKQAA